METTTNTETRPADTATIVAQVGRMNVLAISGGRIEATYGTYNGESFVDGIRLPVRYGYAVEVRLAANDTYIVRRTFTRSGSVSVKEERTEVYCDEVGDAAYTVSCWN